VIYDLFIVVLSHHHITLNYITNNYEIETLITSLVAVNTISSSNWYH